MARKELIVTCQIEGRDYGKTFKLTELPAEQAESWGMRLMWALAKSGADVPPGMLDLGMAGVAHMGLRALAGVPWDEAKVLLDEMMGCVSFLPDMRVPIPRPLVPNDIEEVGTRLWLRDQVIFLHMGFSVLDGISKLTAQMPSSQSDNGQNTETSRNPSLQ